MTIHSNQQSGASSTLSKVAVIITAAGSSTRMGGTIKKESCLKRKIKRHYISRANAYFSPDEESNKYLVHYGANPKVIYNYPYSTIYENEIVKNRPNKEALRKELGIIFDKVFSKYFFTLFIEFIA